MKGFDSGAIQAVKTAIGIVDLVQRYVELRRIGHRWMAPCPFHQETKPSFSVDEAKGFFYCFGCQAAGDIFDFYSRINGVEFSEALIQLALETGVTLVSGQSRSDWPVEYDGKNKRSRERYLALYAWAEDHFRHNLASPAGATCRDYLKYRGLAPDILELFGLGFSLPSWDGLRTFFRTKGVTDDEGVAMGLLAPGKQSGAYDRFRDRLMFSIRNLSNQGIAFGGRVLINKENEGKYINTSDTEIYKKGEYIYGLPQARRTISQVRRALLTEGYMDVLTLHQFGYTNACGVLGTAMTSQQVKRLAGFCSAVDIVFDGDLPGRKAAIRVAEMFLVRGMQCRVVQLPKGEDVDSLLHGVGKETLDVIIAQAVDGLDYCMQILVEGGSGREIIKWAKDFSNQLEDPQLLAFFLPRLSHGLGLSEAELRQTLAPAPIWGVMLPVGQAGPSASPGRSHDFWSSNRTDGQSRLRPTPSIFQTKVSWSQRELAVLHFVLRYPEQLPTLHDRGVLKLLVSSRSRALWEKLWVAIKQGLDPVSFFDAEEKQLWVECQLVKDELAGTAEAEWLEICETLDRVAAADRSRDYLIALRRAKTAGKILDDTPRDIELLKELQDIFRRRDE
ncbi:DNA primase [Desulfovibrionales bacterium]